MISYNVSFGVNSPYSDCSPSTQSNLISSLATYLKLTQSNVSCSCSLLASGRRSSRRSLQSQCSSPSSAYSVNVTFSPNLDKTVMQANVKAFLSILNDICSSPSFDKGTTLLSTSVSSTNSASLSCDAFAALIANLSSSGIGPASVQSCNVSSTIPSPPPTLTTSPISSASSFPLWLIGVIVGALALMALFLIGLIFWVRRRKLSEKCLVSKGELDTPIAMISTTSEPQPSESSPRALVQATSMTRPTTAHDQFDTARPESRSLRVSVSGVRPSLSRLFGSRSSRVDIEPTAGLEGHSSAPIDDSLSPRPSSLSPRPTSSLHRHLSLREVWTESPQDRTSDPISSRALAPGEDITKFAFMEEGSPPAAMDRPRTSLPGARRAGRSSLTDVHEVEYF